MPGTRPIPRRLRRAIATLGVVFAMALVLGWGLESIDRRGQVGDPVHTDRAISNPFDAAFRQGVAALRAGDAHAALRAFDTARAIRPHIPSVHFNIGFSLLALDRPEDARRQFLTGLEIRASEASGYFGLAEAEEALGNLEAARGAMRTYLHLARPEDSHFRRRAAAALWEWSERPPSAAGSGAIPKTEDIRDAERWLSRYRGKFVVLNIWAMWCAPCRAELPALQVLSDTLPSDTFSVLGLNVDKNPALVAEYLHRVGAPFAATSDPGGVAIGKMLPTDVLPLTVILDRQGREIARVQGARDWNAPEIHAALGRIAIADPLAEARLRGALR